MGACSISSVADLYLAEINPSPIMVMNTFCTTLMKRIMKL